MSWAKKLSGTVRFETWRQLVVSRFNYSKDLACTYSQTVWKALQDFYYRSIRSLLKIKSKVKKQTFLAEAMGMEYGSYQEAASRITRFHGKQITEEEKE